MFTFLLVVHALIAAALVAVILMQRSEGGGLGVGGGPAGLMTARGAADLLTRATAVLATLFVLMAFLMAVLAAKRDGVGQIDTSLAHQATPNSIPAPTPAPIGGALPGIPMAGAPAAGAPQQLPVAAVPQQAPADAKAQPVVDKAQAKAAPAIRKIEVKPSNATIGINGVSTAPATHGGNAAAQQAPAAAPASKPIPTLNIAPPPAPASNGAQPQ